MRGGGASRGEAGELGGPRTRGGEGEARGGGEEELEGEERGHLTRGCKRKIPSPAPRAGGGSSYLMIAMIEVLI